MTKFNGVFSEDMKRELVAYICEIPEEKVSCSNCAYYKENICTRFDEEQEPNYFCVCFDTNYAVNEGTEAYWTESWSELNFQWSCECSKCGWVTPYIYAKNYCTNCGAKMRRKVKTDETN